MANCPLMRGLTAYWVFIKIHKIVKMWTQLWQLATIKPLLLLNFHFLVHLRLFKFLFSASFTFKTLEMKLVLVPFKLFLVVKKFPTPRNVTFTFLAVLKSLLLFKTVLHVGHFMSSSTPVSRSSLCLCTFSFQFCFKKGQCKCISIVFAICVFTDVLLQLFLQWQLTIYSIFSNSCLTFFIQKYTTTIDNVRQMLYLAKNISQRKKSSLFFLPYF